MQEYVTQAFVLDSEPAGEADLRVHLFTKELGRVVAFARAARKANSRLAAHVQPLSLVTVRLVERRGFQIVDALIEERFASADLKSTQATVEVAELLKSMTDVYHPDAAIWSLLEQRKLASATMLRVLGFDPAHAHCSNCDKEHPEHFIISTTSYLCSACRRLGASRQANQSAVVV